MVLALAAGTAGCGPADRAPADGTATLDASIAFFADRVAERPDDVLAPAALADRYLMRFGRTHELADVWRADSVLEDALGVRPDHAPLLARKAAVHIARHEFPEALDAARAAWASAPRRSLNGVLFDTWLEVGQFDSARAALNRLDPSSWAYLIRKARFAELHGHFAVADGALERACRAVDNPDPSLRAWCAVRRGDVALAAGRMVHAGRRYDDALDLRPDHGAALRGKANVALARGDTAAARRRLLRATAHPEALEARLTLARLAEARGEPEAAAAWRASFEIRASHSRFGRAMWPLLAEHFAETGRPDTAFALARADFTQRPGPETRATLARVQALAAGS